MQPLSTVLTVSEYLGYELRSSSIVMKDRKISWDSTRVLQIPAYQREISWNEVRVKNLFSDIVNGEKFLGTVLLSTEDQSTYEIIDGQQRTTVIYLIIRCINLALGKDDYKNSVCTFVNETFSQLDKCIELAFDINNETLWAEVQKSDFLNQFDSYKKIWKIIQEEVNSLGNKTQKQSFLRHVNECTLNLIINECSGRESDKKLCVEYYLDLNDKSVPLDNIDILKANLFLENYDTMTKQWSDLLKTLGEISHTVHYPINTFFFHYFLCVANEKMKWKLTTPLKENLKLPKDITIDGQVINKGEHIIRAFQTEGIVFDMFDDLKSCADFYLSILNNDKKHVDEMYLNKLSEERRAIVFSIINSILRNDNLVPKMLVMKYFIYVLRRLDKDESTKKLINSINPIFLSAVYFVVMNQKNRKGSAKFATIVNNPKWDIEIENYATSILQYSYDDIDYMTSITKNNKADEVSGQYFPMYLMIAKQFFEYDAKKKRIELTNTKKLAIALENTRRYNAEHFLINKSYKYTFTYRGTEIEIPMLKKLKKYVSMPFNYLYMDAFANKNNGNATTYEKIQNIESLEADKRAGVFRLEICDKYYAAAREVFFDTTAYPKDLDSYKTEKQAITAVKGYYSKYFENEMKDYIERIRKIRTIYDHNTEEYT